MIQLSKQELKAAVSEASLKSAVDAIHRCAKAIETYGESEIGRNPHTDAVEAFAAATKLLRCVAKNLADSSPTSKEEENLSPVITACFSPPSFNYLSSSDNCNIG